MQKFQAAESHIHVIARGFLVRGNEIILCKPKNADYFFLPGGHVEDGEFARTALLRELTEEIGDSNYKINSFIGVCENIFPIDENISQHEINIVFEVDVPKNIKIDSKEYHIEFVIIKKEDLKKYKILPASLKEGLLEWFEDMKPFLKEIDVSNE